MTHSYIVTRVLTLFTLFSSNVVIGADVINWNVMKHPDSSGHVEQIRIGVPIKTTKGEAAFNFNVLHLWDKLSPVSLFRSGIFSFL